MANEPEPESESVNPNPNLWEPANARKRQSARFAAGLRAAADWYEAHPEIPAPYDQIVNYALDTKEELQMLARALGSFDKRYEDSMFYAIKEIAPGFVLKFVFTRSSICRRIKTGEREIPEHVLPAQEERLIPAHTEDVYEWDCGPILSDREEKKRAQAENSSSLDNNTFAGSDI